MMRDHSNHPSNPTFSVPYPLSHIRLIDIPDYLAALNDDPDAYDDDRSATLYDFPV